MVLLDKLDSELKELHPNKFSIISDLFQGKVRNSIICGLCDKKSSNIEEFTQLALPRRMESSLSEEGVLSCSLLGILIVQGLFFCFLAKGGLFQVSLD